MWQLEAWENELFNQYNGEGHMTQEEFEADAWDELREDSFPELAETEVFEYEEDK